MVVITLMVVTGYGCESAMVGHDKSKFITIAGDVSQGVDTAWSFVEDY